MGKRFEEIDLYGNKEVQLNLFETIENKKRLNPTSFWPKYAKGEKYLREILENPEPYTGIDLEFDPVKEKPTIIGLSNSRLAASAPWNKEVAKFVVKCAKLGITKLVGFSIFGAEKSVLERQLEEELPVEIFEDGMVTHFMLNQDLVKMSQGKEESEKGSVGFLNLWTMNTFYVGLPQFKLCRELDCKGPCPKHDVWGYNAMDTHVGLQGFLKMLEEMKREGIPYSFYRDLMEISNIAQMMQKKGIKINRELVEKLDKITDEEKEKLFNYTGEGKKKKYEYFNPNSPSAAIKYFAQFGIELEQWNSKEIYAALEEAADKESTTLGEMLRDPSSLPLEYQLLIKGYQYKGAGKGFKSWFDDKFFGDDGLIHPRFLVLGTSTGRFSSRNPNFQNIPRFDDKTPVEKQDSFGLARMVIIPREDDLCLIKADKCVAPGTRILCTDLNWKKVEDIKVGESIIGFDETASKGKIGTKYKESFVEANNIIEEDIIRITTDRGITTVSKNHAFVVNVPMSSGGRQRKWVEAKDLKENDSLLFLIEPWEIDNSYEAGWMAGFLDGEGYVASRHVGFGQKDGTITLKKGVEFLEKNNYPFNKNPKATVNKFTNGLGVKKHAISNMPQSLRLLGTIRPIRLLEKSKKVWENARTWGKNTKGAIIQKIEYLGKGKVYAIRTSTKTLISDGFLTHNSNLELRMCLFYSGFDPYKIEKDAFQWMVDNSDGAYKEAAAFLKMSERDVAKSVAHGSNYGEGIILLYPKDLAKKSIREAIKMGAIVLYEDWDYCGGKVAFSGINLASRLFKDTSLESRAKANEILEGVYFKKYHIIREWHRKVLTEIESTGIIRSATKRFVRLNDTPLNNAKNAFSFLGQGTSADHVQGDMLEFYRVHGSDGIPLLQVHDELVFEKPKIWSDEEAISFLSIMEQEDKRIPGFICPVKMYRGENWAQIRRIK